MEVDYNKIDGFFDKHPNDEQKEFVKEIVAAFHFRNGKKQHDGSLGEIKITIKQLNDCLAYAMFYCVMSGVEKEL